jgi:hypothetical protein
MKYIRILWSYACGLIYAAWLMLVPKRRLESVEGKGHPQLVVTLTSYGRRAAKTVPHVLASLLVQTKRPDRIILWLDDVNFSEGRLPKRLAAMRDRYGIEIRFCEDLRSYKKLVPTLELCPEDVLVTVDDDLLYKRRLLEKLYAAHLETPDMRLCPLAHEPVVEKGVFVPYRRWRHNVMYQSGRRVFPLGGSGTLYPPHSLHADVMNKGLFMQLAPQADDVWFWAMGEIAGTKTRLIDFGYPFYQVDLLYQLLHKDASLMASNLHEDNNDKQIRRVVERYPQLMDGFRG